MKSRYIFTARESSDSKNTPYFLEATPGSLKLFPLVTKAILAGAAATGILGFGVLIILYFLAGFLLPSFWAWYALVLVGLLLVYRSQAWIAMNAVRYAKRTTPGVEVKVKQSRIGMMRQMLTIEAEGREFVLRVRSSRRNIVGALEFSGQMPP